MKTPHTTPPNPLKRAQQQVPLWDLGEKLKNQKPKCTSANIYHLTSVSKPQFPNNLTS